MAQKYPPYLLRRKKKKEKEGGREEKRFRGFLDRFAKYLEK